MSPAWKKDSGGRAGSAVGSEGGGRTSSRWKPAQREVLVSVPIRPDQCIAGVAVTRNDLPGVDEEGREKEEDCHQLQGATKTDVESSARFVM